MPVALRTAGKIALPLGLAAVAAGAIAYGPSAFADDSDPNLPALTAEQVVAKIAGANTGALSGDVEISTDLGLPALPGRGNADPSALLSGTHKLHIAVDGPDRQRIAVQADLAEYNIVHNGRDVWTYDSRKNTATHTVLPDGARPGTTPKLPGTATSPQEAAKQLLDLAKAGDTTITADGTDKVAGRAAYKLRITPTTPGSLIGGATVWADAGTGVPLRVVVDTAKGGKPAVDVGFTAVSFTEPAAGTFDFKPPSGAKVVENTGDKAADPKNLKDGLDVTGLTGGPAGTGAPKVHGQGWSTVLELPLPQGLPALTAPQPGKDGSKDGGKDDTGKNDRKDDKAPAVTDLLAKAGTRVDGGTLFTTRVASVLVTDDGRVFVGAVDGATLQAARTAGTAGR